MTAVADASPRSLLSQAASRLRWLPRSILPFVLLGLVASFLAYYATAWGPWAFSDAAGYITAARNLVAGHGIGSFKPNGDFSPTTSHPPLYVLAIGAVSQLGFEPLEAARVLDVLLFGLLVAASGFMVSRLLDSPWAGLAFSALILAHPAMIIAYTSAMAESPFILLGFLSLLFLTEYLREHRNGAFLASSLCAGGALLSRYPGAAFVLTGAAAMLLWGGPGRILRLRQAAAYAAVGGTPVGMFVFWATSIPGAEGPRALADRTEILPGLVRFGRSVVAAAWSWKPIPPAILLPEALRGLNSLNLLVRVFAVIGLLGLAWLCYQTLRRLRAQVRLWDDARPAAHLILGLGLFVGVYLIFFAAAYLITNPTPDVDSRTLLPLLPALLGIAVASARLSGIAWPDRRSLRFSWCALLLASVSGYAVISQDTVLGLHRTGLGYTSRAWRASPTIAAVKELPPDQLVISNEPAAVLLLTGRSAYVIHEIAQREPLDAFTRFGDGDSEAERAFRERGAALVLFDSAKDQFESIYGGRSQERLQILLRDLTLAYEGEDGAIYLSPTGDFGS